MPNYFNKNHFSVGQRVTYAGFAAVIIRHYCEGMWEIRLASGPICVTGADIVAA